MCVCPVEEASSVTRSALNKHFATPIGQLSMLYKLMLAEITTFILVEHSINFSNLPEYTRGNERNFGWSNVSCKVICDSLNFNQNSGDRQQIFICRALNLQRNYGYRRLSYVADPTVGDQGIYSDVLSKEE